MRSELLSQIGGGTDSSSIVVTLIATTRINDLDSAYFRHMPYKIYFPLPARADREGLIDLYAQRNGITFPPGVKEGPGPSCHTLFADKLDGYSSGDVATLMGNLGQFSKKDRVENVGVDFGSDTFTQQLAAMSADEASEMVERIESKAAAAAASAESRQRNSKLPCQQ